MSSIFQGLVQSSTGLVNFSVGTGAIPIIAAEMRGLRINAVADAEGAFPVYASVGQASASVGSGGLSFDAYGRLRITTTVPATIVQLPGGIIADETGSLVVFGPAEILYQGVALTYIGYVSALSQTPVPLFYWPGTHTLAATTGTDPTFTRATAATFEDFEGLIKTVENGEPRFQGARRVENTVASSGNLEVAPWGDITASIASGVSDPDGGTSAYTITANGASSQWYQNSYAHHVVGDTLTNSIYLRRKTGTGNVGMLYQGNPLVLLVTLTNSWQRFSTTFTSSGSGYNYNGIRIYTSGDEVDIWHPQAEVVTGQTNQNPSEYVSTGVASATAPELVVNNTASQYTPYGNNTVTNGAAGEVILTFVDNYEGPYYGLNTSLGGLSENPPIGTTYVLTMDVKVTSGDGVGIRALGGATQNSVGIAPSPSFTTITLTTTFISYSKFYPVGMSAGDVVTIKNVSVKVAEHGANVDGVQYFNTLNANTVTSNVVTEAVGSPLTRANTQFGDLHGVAGDYFSTPNVVTTWGELDIRARAQVDSWSSVNAFLAQKGDCFYFSLSASGSSQRINWGKKSSTGGGYVVNASILLPAETVGTRLWVRGTLDGATGDVKFFTADGNLEAPTISDYVQLGATQNSGAFSVKVDTLPFVIGHYYPFDGDIYRSQVFNEIDGTTPVVDFTPGSYVSGSTLVSSTSGETWTLVGNASIFQPPVDESGPFGYLAEKASTNVCLYSEDFASWPTNVRVTYAAAAAPDGTLGADLVTADAGTNTSHFIHQVAGGPYASAVTFSVWAKAGTYGYFALDLGGLSVKYAIFDLFTGTVGDVSAGFTATMEEHSNGWYRCSITGIHNAGSTSPHILFNSNGTSLAYSFTTAGTESMYWWGAQLELGTYPTSYIPTTTTAVTRNGDLLKLADGIVDGSLGTISFEASSGHNYSGGTSHTLLGIYTTNRMFAGNGINQTGYYPVVGGVLIASGVSRYNTAVQSAMTYNGLDVTVYHGPVSNAGTLPATPMPVQTNPEIGSYNNSIQPDYSFREVKIFDSELTAAEVGDL